MSGDIMQEACKELGIEQDPVTLDISKPLEKTGVEVMMDALHEGAKNLDGMSVRDALAAGGQSWGSQSAFEKGR